MTGINTNIIYNPNRPNASLAQGLGSLAQGFESRRRNQAAEIQLQNAQIKQRQLSDMMERDETFQQDLYDMGDVPFEEKMDLYREIKPYEAFEDQRKMNLRSAGRGAGTIWSGVSGRPGVLYNKVTGEYKQDTGIQEYIDPLKQAEYDRKLAKDASQKDQFQQKQSLDFRKFVLQGDKSAEQIRQFELDQVMDEKKLDFQLNKNDINFRFKQEKQLERLPDNIKNTFNKDRSVYEKDIDKVIKLNDSFGVMSDKLNNITNVIVDEGTFLESKGVGETAVRAKSAIESAVVKYNRDVAELGALAGSDLSMLRGIIPDPTAWKAMTYNAWKKTMDDLQSGLRQQYKRVLNNSGFNVTGKELGTGTPSVKDSITEEQEGWID